jgi:hypothetical protein
VASPVAVVFSEAPTPSAVVTPQRLLSSPCPSDRRRFNGLPNYSGTHCVGGRADDAEGNLLSDRVAVRRYRVASPDRPFMVVEVFQVERIGKGMIEKSPRIVHPLSGRKEDFKAVQGLLSRVRQREKRRSDR